MFDLIAFDADDTLWHNENLFSDAGERFTKIIARYIDPVEAEQRLYQIEIDNLHYYGYGVKSYTLSMIQTALELTNHALTGDDVQQILILGKEMLAHPVECLPGVKKTLAKISKKYRLMVITKGDLFDQESKVARSGLAKYFSDVEVVSEKTPQTYQRIMQAQKVNPKKFLMVGNSVRSDILPVVELGGCAVHIPYHTTWGHEVLNSPDAAKIPCNTLAKISQLPRWLKAQRKKSRA